MSNLTIKSATNIIGYSAPIENGTNFIENAKIKASYLKSLKNDQNVCADDSGLVIKHLNNEPGIHSARYAGENSSSNENIKKVISKLNKLNVDSTEAYFICALYYISKNNFCIIVEEKLNGRVINQQRGLNGFGYDSIFVPINYKQTLAELSKEVKNKVSHRYLAITKLFNQLF